MFFNDGLNIRRMKVDRLKWQVDKHLEGYQYAVSVSVFSWKGGKAERA
jgi:hypothetical protein